MADSDKITHRIDAGGDAIESSQSVGQASGSEAAAAKSVKELDAEWGYEPGKSGMATEAKMGMCIVAILVCAFGFLVYHKYDLKQKALDLAKASQHGGDAVVAQEPSAIDNNERYTEFESQPKTASLKTESTSAIESFAPRVAQAPSATLRDPVDELNDLNGMPPLDQVLVKNDTREAPPEFDFAEPAESVEPIAPLASHEARDVLAAREEFTPEPVQPKPETPASDFASLFDEKPTEVAAADPEISKPAPTPPTPDFDTFAPLEPEPAIENESVVAVEPPVGRDLPAADSPVVDASEPTFDRARIDEPSFAAFDEGEASPMPASVKEQELPVAQVDPPSPFPPSQFDEQPEVTDLPPASEFTDDFEVARSAVSDTGKTLPSAAEVLFAESPAKNASAPGEPQPQRHEYNPTVKTEPATTSLFGDESKVVTNPSPFDDKPNAGEKQEEETRTFGPASSEPALAPAMAETAPPRRSAPMPEFPVAEFPTDEFPIADVTPAPVPVPTPQPVAQPAKDVRRDTFVAMTSPTPDVDAFESDAFAPLPAKSAVPGSTISRDPFAPNQNPVAAQPKAQPKRFSGFQTPSASPLAIPTPAPDVGQPQEGVARFANEAPSHIQQVAAISQECDICEVKTNDSYWNISKRVYGTARYFSSLALYNRDRIPDPSKLKPGMKVLIPDPKLLEQKYPEFFKDSKRKTKQQAGYFLQDNGSPAYRIGDRETLSAISQKHLGRASRWIQIYRMNQHILKDPNKLKPGTVIALPEDATNVRVAP